MKRKKRMGIISIVISAAILISSAVIFSSMSSASEANDEPTSATSGSEAGEKQPTDDVIDPIFRDYADCGSKAALESLRANPYSMGAYFTLTDKSGKSKRAFYMIKIPAYYGDPGETRPIEVFSDGEWLSIPFDELTDELRSIVTYENYTISEFPMTGFINDYDKVGGTAELIKDCPYIFYGKITGIRFSARKYTSSFGSGYSVLKYGEQFLTLYDIEVSDVYTGIVNDRITLVVNGRHASYMTEKQDEAIAEAGLSDDIPVTSDLAIGESYLFTASTAADSLNEYRGVYSKDFAFKPSESANPTSDKSGAPSYESIMAYLDSSFKAVTEPKNLFVMSSYDECFKSARALSMSGDIGGHSMSSMRMMLAGSADYTILVSAKTKIHVQLDDGRIWTIVFGFGDCNESNPGKQDAEYIRQFIAGRLTASEGGKWHAVDWHRDPIYKLFEFMYVDYSYISDFGFEDGSEIIIR